MTNAWLGRGNVLGECKRHEESLAAYDRALALSPDVAEVWLGCGNVLRELGRHDEALGAYDRAGTLKPDLPGAHLGRGNVFCERKDYNAALAAYDQHPSIERGTRRRLAWPWQRFRRAYAPQRGSCRLRSGIGAQARLCRGLARPRQRLRRHPALRRRRRRLTIRHWSSNRTSPKRGSGAAICTRNSNVSTMRWRHTKGARVEARSCRGLVRPRQDLQQNEARRGRVYRAKPCLGVETRLSRSILGRAIYYLEIKSRP